LSVDPPCDHWRALKERRAGFHDVSLRHRVGRFGFGAASHDRSDDVLHAHDGTGGRVGTSNT
jgi:hypothetical protein